MKVLIINTYDSGGGAHNFCRLFLDANRDICKMLVHKKTSNDSSIKEIQEPFFEKHIPFVDKVLWKLGYKNGFRNTFSLHDSLHYTYKFLEKEPFYKKADIINLHNIHGSYFDFNALEKILMEKPVIFSMHDMWAFTGGETYMPGVEEYKTGIPESPIPKHYPFYGSITDRRSYYYKRKKQLFQKFHDRITFVCGSKWLESSFKKSFVYNEGLKTTVIREGVNVDLFKNQKKRTWTKPRVLIVNSGIFYKGTELLNDVLPKCNDTFELYIIGDDIDLKHKNQQSKKLNYLKSEAEINDIFNNVDVLLFPSLQDNSPLFVTMALLCGVYVIGGDNSGVYNQIKDCGGETFNLNDKDSLIMSLNSLCSRLNEIRSIGDKAAQVAKNLFCDKLMYKSYRELYSKILS